MLRFGVSQVCGQLIIFPCLAVILGNRLSGFINESHAVQDIMITLFSRFLAIHMPFGHFVLRPFLFRKARPGHIMPPHIPALPLFHTIRGL